MYNLDFSQGVEANLMRLLCKGYEIRIKPMEQQGLGILSVTAAHPRKDIYVMQKGTPRDLDAVVTSVFEMVEAAEKDNAAIWMPTKFEGSA